MSRYDNIPRELKELKQWVCVTSDSKAPMRANHPFVPASSTDPSTWATFEDAVWAVNIGWYDYIGFVFADNGIVGIDLDDAFTEDTAPIARDILEQCDGTYAEYSKSGDGLHIFVYGDIPFKGKNNLSGVEMYKAARFFIMTGDSLPHDGICEKQNALDYIVNKYFPETREATVRQVTPRIYNPQWDSPKGNKRVRIKPNYPIIPDGCRNICLTSLAGMMHSVGYTKGQIYRELQYANDTACRPPLSLNELKCICNSVTRYKR